MTEPRCRVCLEIISRVDQRGRPPLTCIAHAHKTNRWRRRGYEKPARPRTEVSKAALVAMRAYAERGLPTAEIARAVGHTVTVVTLRLREMGFVGKRIRTTGMSAAQRAQFIELVDGVVIGDGFITRNGAFSLLNNIKRAGWVDAVQRRLRALGFITKKTRIMRRKSGRRRYYTLLTTPVYAELKEQRARWYPTGVKAIPPDVRLTPQALADWFSGDGYGARSQLGLCTDSFTLADVTRVAEQIDRVHGTCSRVIRPEAPRIVWYKSLDRAVLADVVMPWLPECTKYKFAAAAAPGQPQWRRVWDRRHATTYGPQPNRDVLRYCLTCCRTQPRQMFLAPTLKSGYSTKCATCRE